MGCVPCAKRAALRNTKWRWTDGVNVVIYDTEMAAKAKTFRKGGTYAPVSPNGNQDA